MTRKLKKYYLKGVLEAGCDEAGRGCLAGPVVAASVILPTDFYHPLLNDSKQMTEKHREELRFIIEKNAIAWAVAEVSHIEIDEINILNASILAMHRALNSLKQEPQHILVDGNRFHAYKRVKHLCVIKGDATFASIAAASVLAKTHRDEKMKMLNEEYPGYGWDRNKGYPTIEHRQAIQQLGITAYHRKSFALLPRQLELDFSLSAADRERSLTR